MQSISILLLKVEFTGGKWIMFLSFIPSDNYVTSLLNLSLEELFDWLFFKPASSSTTTLVITITSYFIEILVELPMPCMCKPDRMPPPPPTSPHIYKFKRLGNPKILFNLATLHRLNWFVPAAANVLLGWIFAFYLVRCNVVGEGSSARNSSARKPVFQANFK